MFVPHRLISIGTRSCSLSNGKSLSRSLLLGNSHNWLVSLGNVSSSLNAVELNVTVGGDVRSDTTMSTESSSATIDSALDCNVTDDALLGVESFGLSVALQVDKQFFDSLTGLLWPSTIGPLVHSNLSVSGDVFVVSSERNNLFMSDDSIHVLDGSWNSHALDVVGSFEGVLKVNSKVRNLGFGG